MALSELQKAILRVLAKHRSESSYLAGGLILNKDWPRRSDDIDIFHDADEQVAEAANLDIEALNAAGFKVNRDFIIYGCVDATVSDRSDSTVIQWFAETKLRFFPLVRDEEWGARLHQADLAVNKVLAVSGRSKARDIADLVAIGRQYCAIGPLVLAAAGKPPNFSPLRIVDEMRRHTRSIPADEFAAVKGLPDEWTAAFIREEALIMLDAAERYVLGTAPDLVGLLASGPDGTPIEVGETNRADVVLRKATEEPEVVAAPAGFTAIDWSPGRP